MQVGRVDAHERAPHLLAHGGGAHEAPELRALGRGRGVEENLAFAHEDEQGGAEARRGGEEGAVAEAQLEVLEPHGEAVGLEARGVEGEVDETVDLSQGLTGRHGPSLPVSLEEEAAFVHPSPGLGHAEHLRRGPDAHHLRADLGGPLQGQLDFLGAEELVEGLLLRALGGLVGEREEGEHGLNVAGAEGRLELVHGGGHGGGPHRRGLRVNLGGHHQKQGEAQGAGAARREMGSSVQAFEKGLGRRTHGAQGKVPQGL